MKLPLLSRLRITRRGIVRATLIVGVPLVAAAVGGYFYATGGRYVSTENAYVKADVASVSADVSGQVVEVAVHQHEAVQPGQLLFRLDATPYRFALQQAEARMAEVRRQIAALHASYQAAKAELAVAEETLTYQEREYKRRRALASRGVMPQEQLDSAQHAFRNAQLRVDAQQQALGQVLAQLGGQPDLPVEQDPSFRQARAQRDEAAWKLGRTVVKATVAGIVGQEPPAIGEFVQAGVPVFSLVGSRPWIEANLKETELTHVQVGQEASVTVDAYPGHTWRARVTSISPATGAEFSLLPAQNASGNWVKVVQRLPVRLSIDPVPGAPQLHSGMSVGVEIDTRHRRVLPAIVAKALAWTPLQP